MEREDDIIDLWKEYSHFGADTEWGYKFGCHLSYLHRVNASRVKREVVILDAVDPVEGDVEHAIQDEPDDVEG